MSVRRGGLRRPRGSIVSAGANFDLLALIADDETMGRRDNYTNGRRAEWEVARRHALAGCAGVRLSPGSRGPADIIADWCPFAPQGLALQVKSTTLRRDPCASIPPAAQRRLRRLGRASGKVTGYACVFADGRIEIRARPRR